MNSDHSTNQSHDKRDENFAELDITALVIQAMDERKAMGKDKDHPPAMILFDTCDPRKEECDVAVTCWESFEQYKRLAGAMNKYQQRGLDRIRSAAASLGGAIVVCMKTEGGMNVSFVQIEQVAESTEFRLLRSERWEVDE